MDMVGRGGVLSKVDLSKGFHQVEVVEEDRDKTSFICPFGKFRYKRMPFGLVVTDHRSLVTLMSAHQHNRDSAMKLTEFTFEIIYRKGSDNVVADCLSRCH